MYASLLRWGRLLIAAVLIFFLLKRLYKLLAEIEVEVIALQSPFWLIFSLILLLVYFSGLGIPWFFSYRAGREKSISFLSGWTFFQLSQLGRYLPGRIGQFVWMLSFSRGFGIEKTHAILATCIQLAFQCCLGCILGLPILRHSGTPRLQNWVASSFQIPYKTGVLIAGLGIVILGGVVLLYRYRIQQTLPRLIKQCRAMFSVSGVPWLAGAYLLLWGLLGIAFFFHQEPLLCIYFTVPCCNGDLCRGVEHRISQRYHAKRLGYSRRSLKYVPDKCPATCNSHACRTPLPTLDVEC